MIIKKKSGRSVLYRSVICMTAISNARMRCFLVWFGIVAAGSGGRGAGTCTEMSSAQMASCERGEMSGGRRAERRGAEKMRAMRLVLVRSAAYTTVKHSALPNLPNSKPPLLLRFFFYNYLKGLACCRVYTLLLSIEK